MTAPNPPLPADLPDQVYVSVKALCPGKLHLPYAWVFQDCIDQPESVGSWVPTFSFLISHPTKGHAMFDLGLRKVSNALPTDISGTDSIVYSMLEDTRLPSMMILPRLGLRASTTPLKFYKAAASRRPISGLLSIGEFSTTCGAADSNIHSHLSSPPVESFALGPCR